MDEHSLVRVFVLQGDLASAQDEAEHIQQGDEE